MVIIGNLKYRAIDSNGEYNFRRDIELPYDAEIEYLESTGTQWIDTGIVCRSYDGISAKFQANGQQLGGNAYFFFGQGVNVINSNIELYTAVPKEKISFCIQGNADAILDYTNVFNVNVENKVVTFTDDFGQVLAVANRINAGDYTASYTMAVFATHRASILRKGNVRCFKFQIIQDSAVVIDLIPVRIGQTGYMYDKVSGQLFGNSGTGDFILGPDKYDSEIEYLLSTGTQYIDTGIICSANAVYETYSAYLGNGAEGCDVNSDFFFVGVLSNKYYAFIGGSSGLGNVGVNNDSQKHKFVIAKGTNTVSSSGFYIDNILYRNEISPKANTTEFYLFACSENTNPKAKFFINQRKYSARIWNNNSLVRDFIPVRVRNVGYLYDRISGRLFANAGTGNFVLGPDVNDIIMTSDSNPEVMKICYAQGWCANPDYMTKNEAAAVTSIGEVFKGTNITHFEELQYFGITSLYQMAFQNCTSLTSIVLPSTVSSLGQRAFQGCTALTAITIPSSVTTFPNTLFCDCTALETVIKGSITSIGGDCFRSCSALTSYTFDSGLTTIGQAAFYNTQNIVFTNDIPSTVSSISKQAFQSTGFTGKLTIPSGITTINERLFQSAKCSEIVLPSTITTVSAFAFYDTSNLESLTVLATTPPTASGSNSTFSRFGKTGCVIYVPSASVEDYKTADGWSTVASKIQAIPT